MQGSEQMFIDFHDHVKFQVSVNKRGKENTLTGCYILYTRTRLFFKWLDIKINSNIRTECLYIAYISIIALRWGNLCPSSVSKLLEMFNAFNDCSGCRADSGKSYIPLSPSISLSSDCNPIKVPSCIVRIRFFSKCKLSRNRWCRKMPTGMCDMWFCLRCL